MTQIVNLHVNQFLWLRRIRKQRFLNGLAWGAITRGELCADVEDGRGGRGENGIRGQRSSVTHKIYKSNMRPRWTVNRIQKKNQKIL